ncbi:hypothetical protein Bca52824_047652 [Brassica carinata]|uniref:pectinesterase n=1 Tax=Brassica carinata TaxID=52824 RepID=A0A8X7RJD2_BRACI|nr:hypothetical protein Bca52824_047652 [Brassica carinata]
MEEASSSPLSQNPPTRGVSLWSDKAFDTQAPMEEAIGKTLITDAAAPYVLQRLGGPQTMNPDATAPSVLQRLSPQIMIPGNAGPSAGTPTANRKYGRPPWKKVVRATLKPGVAGYITAPGRTNPYDASGFVFTDYLVHGTGKAFLGRPWCSYARVIFYNTDLSDVVVPQGWDSWHFGGHVSQLTFAEIGCYGSGSNTGRRVSWVKKLSGFCVQSMIRLAFINSGGWVQALPIPV